MIEYFRTEFHPDEATRDVGGRRMNAAPQARQAALIRGVDIIRPIERDIDTRPVLEDEEIVNGVLDEQTLGSYLEPFKLVFNSDVGREFLLSGVYSGDPDFDQYVIDYMGLRE